MYRTFYLPMYLKYLFSLINCFFWYFYKFLKRIYIEYRDSNHIEVLHQSQHFLAINKPYDMVINSNNSNAKKSVQLIIRKMFPELVNSNLYHEFYFVHRLDYVTSGALCIALNKKSAQAASVAFEERNVQKYYLAFVHGHVKKQSLVIDVPIGNDIRELNGSRKMCSSNDQFCCKPRKSCTALLVLEKGYKNNKPVTKILLYPKTGRRHQLRVHCSYIGHVIVGDYTYSGKTDIEPYRTFLHALRLTIINAVENIDVQTIDPFSSTNGMNDWKPTDIVRILNESAFSDIQKLIIDK